MEGCCASAQYLAMIFRTLQGLRPLATCKKIHLFWDSNHFVRPKGNENALQFDLRFFCWRVFSSQDSLCEVAKWLKILKDLVESLPV